MAGALQLWAVAAALLLLWNGSGDGPAGAEAGRVLGLFYFPGRSHFIIYEKYLKELAARGHQVDVVSHFPQSTPLPNYRDISLKGSAPSMVNLFSIDDLLNMHFFRLMYFTWEGNLEMCRKAMEHPGFKSVLESKNHYDLVLVEIFGVDCAYGYAHLLRAPVIALTTLIGLPWGQERVGNPDNPAYVPVAFMPYLPRMTFWERIVNTASQTYARWGEKIRGRWPTDRMLREYLGPEIPPLSELVLNTSLVMVNSHFSINGARPTVPGYLEVGGMHIDTVPEKLPKELQAFVDGAGPAGAVLVSFGSLFAAETMSPEKLSAFLAVLGALPQRVVWRIDPTRVAGGVPPNVYGSPWLPQQALLSHPKMRAFVTHGGLGSTQEAVYWGVPTVIVPFFTDQRQNGFMLQDKGAGRVLQYYGISTETLGEALDAVLNDPRYRDGAKKLSEEFRDRPQTPLETAVFWTEYVMRHKGAPHLRSAAVDLTWYQLCLLDVLAVLTAAALLMAAMLWLTTRAILRCVCGGRQSKKAKTS